MTYYTAGAPKPFESLTSDFLCFECGKEIKNASVGYDGHATENHIKSLYFHPSCAALVGQRLITDGYRNRHTD